MNIDASVTTRIPRVLYLGQNGYFRGPAEPDEVVNVEEALAAHRRALFVIEHKKRAVPDFETMQAELEKPDDLGTVTEKLSSLQSEHLEDLERLYATQTQDYMREAMDMYRSKDEVPFSSDSPPDANAKLQEIYNGAFKDVPFELRCTDDYELLRYTYLSQLLPLKKHQLQLEKEEEVRRRRAAQMFPQSIEDFNNKSRDVQLRAARFLQADAARQEKMLSEFQWAWRQVKPLQDIFAKDKAFNGEIVGMLLAEKMLPAKDPRKRML